VEGRLEEKKGRRARKRIEKGRKLARR